MGASTPKFYGCRATLYAHSPANSQTDQTTCHRPAAPAAPVGVLVVDDHPIVRAGVIDLLSEHDWLKVVGQAGDGREALAKARELSPDIIVVDITMPRLNGLTLTKTLRAEFPQLAVVILSMHGPDQVAEHILQSGARGYVCKKVASMELIRALEVVATGGTYFDTYFSQVVLKQFSRDSGDKQSLITPREREVLACIAEGLSNKEIASQLGLGLRTVDTHRQRLIRKLDIHTTAGLTRFALEHGIITLSEDTIPAALVV